MRVGKKLAVKLLGVDPEHRNTCYVSAIKLHLECMQTRR